MSRYDDIQAALLARLGEILIANGYRTDAGERVWLNLEYQTAPPEKPCLILYPGEVSDSLDGDTPASLGEENHLLPIVIEGFIVDSERGDQAAALWQDVQKALKTDPWFGGLTEGFSGSFVSSSRVEDAGEAGMLGFVRVECSIFYATEYGDA